MMLINAVVIMTGTVSFYIFVVMSSPLPIRQGMKCVEDDVFRALKTNSSNALDLCRAYINETVVTVMKKETTTQLTANATVTRTDSAQRTLAFTVFQDFLVTATSATPCSDSTPLSAPTTTPAQRIERDSLPSTTTTNLLQSQIRSACRCLNTGPFTETKTITETVPTSVATITQRALAGNANPVLEFVTVGATNTVVIYSCL